MSRPVAFQASGAILVDACIAHPLPAAYARLAREAGTGDEPVTAIGHAAVLGESSGIELPARHQATSLACGSTDTF